MNEQLQNQLSNILEKSQHNLGQAVDFAMEQAPLLCQEIVRFGKFESVMGVTVSLIIFLVSIRVIYKSYKSLQKERKRNLDPSTSMLLIIISSFSLIVSATRLIANITILGQCCLAPRVYLIDWFSNHLVSHVK